MTWFLDVNVLLALAWPQHAHHPAVNRWVLAQSRPISIATCPITQLGFVRVSMNVKGYAQDFNSAIGMLQLLVSRGNFEHEFWEDNNSLFSISGLVPVKIKALELTDCYLVHLAKSRGGRLVTCDQGIKDSSVELIS